MIQTPTFKRKEFTYSVTTVVVAKVSLPMKWHVSVVNGGKNRILLLPTPNADDGRGWGI